MTAAIILDADFLSSFLKIDQASLIRDFYQDARILVPPAVYREISQTDLVPKLVSLDWIVMEVPAAARLGELVQSLQEKDRYGFRADVLDLLLS